MANVQQWSCRRTLEADAGVKVNTEPEEMQVQISEFAALTGVSARALRHYEDRGLLGPDRTSSGYRDYSERDATRVAQVRAMIDAGLNTVAIRRYLDCARTEEHGTTLEMCPALRADLDALARRLAAKSAELRETERRLRDLDPVGAGRAPNGGCDAS